MTMSLTDIEFQKAMAPAVERGETPENGGALLLGGNADERRKRLQEERRREYNELLNKVKHLQIFIPYNLSPQPALCASFDLVVVGRAHHVRFF